MGRKAELSVQEQWRAAGKQSRIQNAVQCRHCGHFELKNTSRQAIHLADCKPYLIYQLGRIDKRVSKHPEASGHRIMNSRALKRKNTSPGTGDDEVKRSDSELDEEGTIIPVEVTPFEATKYIESCQSDMQFMGSQTMTMQSSQA
jgi:hypothetical protein